MQTSLDQRAKGRHGAQRRPHPSKSCGRAGSPRPRPRRAAELRGAARSGAGCPGRERGAVRWRERRWRASRSPPRFSAPGCAGGDTGARGSAGSGDSRFPIPPGAATCCAARIGASPGPGRLGGWVGGWLWGGRGGATVSRGARGVYFFFFPWLWVCVRLPAPGRCARGVSAARGALVRGSERSCGCAGIRGGCWARGCACAGGAGCGGLAGGHACVRGGVALRACGV